MEAKKKVVKVKSASKNCLNAEKKLSKTAIFMRTMPKGQIYDMRAVLK